MRSAVLALLLTGCTYSQVSRIDQPGQTNIFLADVSDSQPAVVVYRITPNRGEPMRSDETRRSFSLRPGRYLFSMSCLRPGGALALDGLDTRNFEIPEGGPYELDCAPVRGDANYTLRPVHPDGV
jgi:hypothetical protein